MSDVKKSDNYSKATTSSLHSISRQQLLRSLSNLDKNDYKKVLTLVASDIQATVVNDICFDSHKAMKTQAAYTNYKHLFDPNEKRYVTYSVLQQAYLHAIEQGVEEYVMVTTCAIERYLRILGVPTSRLGDGLSMDIGGVNSVAIKMNVNDEFKRAVFSIH